MRRTHCLWFVVVFGLSIAHEAFAPARLFAQGKNVGPAPLTPEQQKEVDEAIWARERRELIWQVPAFIAVLAFATGVFWLPWLLDLRRTKTLAPVAHDLRMKFNGRATEEERALFSKLSISQLGSFLGSWLGFGGSWRNVMRGRFGGVNVLSVDYRCHIAGRKTRSKTTLAIFLNAAPDLPDFVLVPRVDLKSRASVLNLELESSPELNLGKEPVHPFASQYRVGARDSRSVATVFTPQVMDFFAEHKNWNVEVLAHHVAVYRLDSLVKPADYPKRLEKAFAILKTLRAGALKSSKGTSQTR